MATCEDPVASELALRHLLTARISYLAPGQGITSTQNAAWALGGCVYRHSAIDASVDSSVQTRVENAGLACSWWRRGRA